MRKTFRLDRRRCCRKCGNRPHRAGCGPCSRQCSFHARKLFQVEPAYSARSRMHFLSIHCEYLLWHFSNLDRATIRRSWHLRCSFSETTQNRIIRPRQPRPSIESVKLPAISRKFKLNYNEIQVKLNFFQISFLIG